MDPQACTATGALLGSAGPNRIYRDFAGRSAWRAPGTVQATANSRAGVHLNPGESDLGATFNSDIDNPTCLGATSWWYGIGAPAPAGTIDFFTVVLHEIGHGIGVLSLVNLTTGAKFGGFDDAYERWLWDWTLGGWPGLTNAQRVASAVNTGQVIFWGPRATEAARGFLSAGSQRGFPSSLCPQPGPGWLLDLALRYRPDPERAHGTVHHATAGPVCVLDKRPAGGRRLETPGQWRVRLRRLGYLDLEPHGWMAPTHCRGSLEPRALERQFRRCLRRDVAVERDEPKLVTVDQR